MNAVQLDYKNIESMLPQDIYALYLKTIISISFTRREIDVIACMLSGRSAKKTGSFLSIAPKTVENHLRNIMLKLGCRSQEAIIDLIEKSAEFIFIKKYYSSLLIQSIFEQELNKIFTLLNKVNFCCKIIYHREQENKKYLIAQIEKHLELAGIKVSIEIHQELDTKPLAFCEEKPNQMSHIIYSLPPTFAEQFKKNDHARMLQFTTFIFLGQESSIIVPEELSSIGYMDFSKKTNYYFLVFDILKKLLPNKNLDTHILEFKKQYKTLCSPDFLQIEPKKINSFLSNTNNKFTNSLKNKLNSPVGFIFFLIFIYFVHTYFNKKNIAALKFEAQNPAMLKEIFWENSKFNKNSIVWNLPRQDHIFVGREKLLKELDGNLNQKTKSKMVDTLVINACVGLAGIGKTELVLQYLRNTKHSYPIKIWFEAENVKELQSQYQKFAENCGYKTNSDSVSSDKEVEAVIQYVKGWLENNPDWLIVYDNANNYEEIKDLLPIKGGHIIITSRFQEWPQKIKILPVDLMEPFDANNLVRELIGRNEPEIDSLSKKLGYLPLSLAQASAYIKSHGKTVEQYLKLYDQFEYNLLIDKTMPLGVNHVPVAVAWEMSLKTIESDNNKKGMPSLSRALLTVCAYLNSKNISRDFLLNWLKKEHPQLTTPELVLNQTLGELRKHSLITLNDSHVSLHRLIQTILCYQHKIFPEKFLGKYYSQLTPEWYERLLEIVHSEFSEKTQALEDPDKERSMFPHLQKLVDHYENLWPQKKSQTLGIILNDIGLILHHQLYDSKEAKSYFKRAVEILQNYRTKNNIMVINTLNNLGTVCRELGDLQEAKMHLESALNISKDHVENNHEIINTLNNLANVYGEFGNSQDIIKAKIILERALMISQKHFGKNHFKTAITLHNLGNTYRELGHANQAKIILEQAIEIKESIYGKNHVEVARTLNRLGDVYKDLGDAKLAKNFILRALIINEQKYGKDHIYITGTLNRLGELDTVLGNPREASPILERSLEIRELYYGKNHMWLTWSLDSLGDVYRELGHLDKSKICLERSLSILEKSCHKNHISIARTLIKLSHTYTKLGNLIEAKKSLERALIINEKYYDKNHIEISKTLTFLGDIYTKSGDFKQAKIFLENSLKIAENYYGKHHIEVGKILLYFSELYVNLGEYNKAKMVLGKALKINEFYYGKEHAKTIETLQNLIVISKLLRR